MARMKNSGKDKGKRKELASLSHPPSQPRPQIQFFNSEGQQERYSILFESQEVLEGRYLDLTFLESINFPYIKRLRSLVGGISKLSIDVYMKMQLGLFTQMLIIHITRGNRTKSLKQTLENISLKLL